MIQPNTAVAEPFAVVISENSGGQERPSLLDPPTVFQHE